MNVSSSVPAKSVDHEASDRWLPAGHVSMRPNLSLIPQALAIFRRRRWLILGCIVASLLIGVLATILATPQYTASTNVEIQREGQNFAAVEGQQQSESGRWMDNEFYQTQYGLLESRSLAERVAVQLRLESDASFFRMFKVKEAEEWFEGDRLKSNAAKRDERVKVAATVLLKRVQIVPERLSRLVAINFTSPDPAFSQKVANSWAAQFIQQTLARRFDTTAYARRFLEARLEQLRVKIDQSERQLVNYASQEAIVNLPASGGTKDNPNPERPLVADDLASLNQELAQATADRIRAESRLGNSAANQTAEALQSTGVGQLRAQRATLAADYARMMVQFEPEYPPAVAIRRQMAQLDAAIKSEENRFGGSLRDVYNSSVERETRLQAQVKSLQAKMLDFRRRSIQYNIYQRDVDTNQQLYDALLQRYKEIGVAGGVGANNISIVDPAELPVKPSSPRPLINLALALLGGLVIGVGAALVIEQIDDRVRNPADVPNLLGVALLGTTPNVGEDIRQSLSDVKSSLSEAYLSLQTNLTFSTPHGVPKTLAVVSSQPAEGKSTTSYALARALSRGGARVLLIDGDMRSPSVHHFFDMRNESGLSNLLSGQAVDTPWATSGVAGLYVMTAGPQPPSAAELLTGDGLRDLLQKLAEQFDHIVIDSPPVMGLADAPLIGTAVEAVVFVIDAQSTRRSLAQGAIRRLFAAHNHVLGAVVTKYDTKSSSYGYGYEYHYNYGNPGSDKAA